MKKILNKIYWWMTSIILVCLLVRLPFDPKLQCWGAVLMFPLCAMIISAFLIIPTAIFFPFVVLFFPRKHPLYREVMFRGKLPKGDEFDVFRR